MMLGDQPGPLSPCPLTLEPRAAPRCNFCIFLLTNPLSPPLRPPSTPFISSQHAMCQAGNASPGPGTYSVEGGRDKAVSGLGDGPTPKFGTEIRVPPHGDKVPGPGAYQPKSVSQVLPPPSLPHISPLPLPPPPPTHPTPPHPTHIPPPPTPPHKHPTSPFPSLSHPISYPLHSHQRFA